MRTSASGCRWRSARTAGVTISLAVKPTVIRPGSAAARARVAAGSAARSSAAAAGQEDLPGLGEPAALRRAVQQAGAHLTFEAADLPAQGRLGDAEGGGGAAEVPVLGDGGEVAHQPQVQVRWRRLRHGRERSPHMRRVGRVRREELR